MPLAEKMLSESWESWTKWPERPLHWYQLSESDFQGKRPWKSTSRRMWRKCYFLSLLPTLANAGFFLSTDISIAMGISV